MKSITIQHSNYLARRPFIRSVFFAAFLLLVLNQSSFAENILSQRESHLVTSQAGPEHHYPAGEIFLGRIDAKKLRTGKGVYRWTDGKVYIGNFVNNRRQGLGVFTNTKGGIYAGEWKNDKPHGTGFDTVGKKTRIGLFQNGKFVGQSQRDLANAFKLIANHHYSQNTDAFFKDLLSLVRKGSIEAHFALGLLYQAESARYVKTISVPWYPRAQTYQVPSRNLEKAEYHFLIAARAGHAKSQFQLGRLYFDRNNSLELGIANDEEISAHFFSLAHSNGFWPKGFPDHNAVVRELGISGSQLRAREPRPIVSPKCDVINSSFAEIQDCSERRKKLLRKATLQKEAVVKSRNQLFNSFKVAKKKKSAVPVRAEKPAGKIAAGATRPAGLKQPSHSCYRNAGPSLWDDERTMTAFNKQVELYKRNRKPRIASLEKHGFVQNSINYVAAYVAFDQYNNGRKAKKSSWQPVERLDIYRSENTCDKIYDAYSTLDEWARAFGRDYRKLKPNWRQTMITPK